MLKIDIFIYFIFNAQSTMKVHAEKNMIRTGIAVCLFCILITKNVHGYFSLFKLRFEIKQPQSQTNQNYHCEMLLLF